MDKRNTAHAPSASDRALTILTVLVLAAIAVIFFARLGSHGFWEPWEPLYPEGAFEMRQSGNWVVPTYQGEARLSKPILTYWAIAAATWLLGDNDFAVRLPTALFSFAAVVIAWAAMRGLGGRRCGLLAALVLGTSPLIYLLARRSVPDTYLLGGMTIASAALARAYFGPEPRRRWYMIGYIGIAMAVVGKGPLGLVLPSLAVVFYVVYTFDYETLRREALLGRFAVVLSLLAVSAVVAASGVLIGWAEKISDSVPLKGVLDPVAARARAAVGLPVAVFGLELVAAALAAGSAVIALGLLRHPGGARLRTGLKFLTRESALCAAVVLLLAGPWYAAVYLREGSEFTYLFVIHRHLESFAGKIRSSGMFELYFKPLFLGFIPWFAFLPAALVDAFARRNAAGADRTLAAPGGGSLADPNGAGTARGGPGVFLAGWGVLTAFVFMIAVTQFYHYFAPAIPPLALLVALSLDRFLDSAPRRRPQALLLMAPLLVLPAAADFVTPGYEQILRLFSAHTFIDPGIQRAMFPWAWAAWGLFLAAMLLWLLTDRWRTAATLGTVAVVGFSIVMTSGFMSRVGKFKSPESVIESLRRLAGQDHVVSFAPVTAPIVYHARNDVEFLNGRVDRLIQAIETSGSLYFIAPANSAASVSPYLARQGMAIEFLDTTSHYRYKVMHAWKLKPTERPKRLQPPGSAVEPSEED